MGLLFSIGLSSELTELLSSCISGISKIIELNGSKLWDLLLQLLQIIQL